MKEKLIVALDVAGRKEALGLVEQLTGSVGAFKIGMQLFNSEGPGIVKEIQGLGGKVFVDLKFHDIPNTVAQVAKVITGMKVFMFNVHAAGGFEMMHRAAEAAKEATGRLEAKRPLVIGVTVLTSISQDVFEQEVGIVRPIEEQVTAWAKLAQKAGLDGVVASPREILPLRKACGSDFLIVTPGVRPLWAATNDQKRVMTPNKNPREAAAKIIEEMEEGANA